MGPHRQLGGPPQVHGIVVAARCQSPGRHCRRPDTQVPDQLGHRAKFFRRAFGEWRDPQPLDSGRRGARLLRRGGAFLIVTVPYGNVQRAALGRLVWLNVLAVSSPGVGRWQGLGRRRACRAEKVLGEGRVVGWPEFPRHAQAGTPRPVEAVKLTAWQRADRGLEERDLGGGHPKAPVAQHAGERDQRSRRVR